MQYNLSKPRERPRPATDQRLLLTNWLANYANQIGGTCLDPEPPPKSPTLAAPNPFLSYRRSFYCAHTTPPNRRGLSKTLHLCISPAVRHLTVHRTKHVVWCLRSSSVDAVGVARPRTDVAPNCTRVRAFHHQVIDGLRVPDAERAKNNHLAIDAASTCPLSTHNSEALAIWRTSSVKVLRPAISVTESQRWWYPETAFDTSSSLNTPRLQSWSIQFHPPGGQRSPMQPVNNNPTIYSNIC
jgi:hypothetical protein